MSLPTTGPAVIGGDDAFANLGAPVANSNTIGGDDAFAALAPKNFGTPSPIDPTDPNIAWMQGKVPDSYNPSPIFSNPAARGAGLTVRTASPWLAAPAVGTLMAGGDAAIGAPAGLLGMTVMKGLVDPAVQGYNSLSKNWGQAPIAPPSQGIDTLEDKLGLPRPLTKAEKITDAAGQGMLSGAALPAGIGATLESAASPVAQGVGKALSAQPINQAVSGALAGGSGEAVDPEGTHPILRTVTALATGALPFAPEALSAASSAAKAPLRGGASPEQVQDNLAMFNKVGASPTVGQVTGKIAGQTGPTGRAAQTVESALSSVPGGEGVMHGAAEAQHEAIGGKVNEMADSLDPMANPVTSGAKIQEGITNNFIPEARKTESQLWNEVGENINPDTKFSPANLSSAVDKLLSNSEATGAGSAIGGDLGNFLGAIKKGIASDTQVPTIDIINPESEMNPSAPRTIKVPDSSQSAGMTFSQLQSIRTQIGQSIEAEQGNALGSTPKLGALKTLYGAISGDLGEASKTAGPHAQNAFNRANNYSRSLNQRLDLISPVVNKAAGPEQVFQSAMANTKQGATTLNAIMKSLPPSAQKSTTAAVLKRMGTANPGAQDNTGNVFSTSTFLTNWNRLSPQAKQTLFQRYGPTFSSDVDAISGVSSNIKQGSKVFANPSGTAGKSGLIHIITLLAAGAGDAKIEGMAHGAAHILGIMGGSNLAAKAMTNPSFVRWLAKAAPQYNSGAIPAALNNMNQAANKSGDPDFKEVAQQLMQQSKATTAPGGKNSIALPVKPAKVSSNEPLTSSNSQAQTGQVSGQPNTPGVNPVVAGASSPGVSIANLGSRVPGATVASTRPRILDASGDKVADFINKMYAPAQKAAAKIGTSPESLLAQWAYESGWGQSKLSKSANNFGGIKAKQGEPSVAMLSGEKNNTETDLSNFRKFDSPDDYADGYVKTIMNPRYAAALGKTDPREYAKTLVQAGYAQDTPDAYANQVRNIANRIKQRIQNGPSGI